MLFVIRCENLAEFEQDLVFFFSLRGVFCSGMGKAFEQAEKKFPEARFRYKKAKLLEFFLIQIEIMVISTRFESLVKIVQRFLFL